MHFPDDRRAPGRDACDQGADRSCRRANYRFFEGSPSSVSMLPGEIELAAFGSRIDAAMVRPERSLRHGTGARAARLIACLKLSDKSSRLFRLGVISLWPFRSFRPVRCRRRRHRRSRRSMRPASASKYRSRPPPAALRLCAPAPPARARSLSKERRAPVTPVTET